MRKPLAITLVILAVLGAATVFEWRYSADMQEHISRVNSDLSEARLDSALSTGLFGSLSVMKKEIEVGTEIISTHEHVHTLKDEVLAWKIKKVVENSDTVGQATYAAIGRWPDLVQ